VDTRFVDDNLQTLLPPVPELSPAALIAAAIAEMQGQPQAVTPANNSNNGDIYSPWNRTDSFRIGE
jgi:hypothetical protein